MWQLLKKMWLPLICGFVFLQAYQAGSVLATYRSITPRNQGVSVTATMMPTLCAQDPSSPPDSAVNNLDHQVADWGAFCEGAPTWTMQQVTMPSLDGEALRCGLAGGTAYSNIHCYRDIRAEPASNVFTYTTSFWFSPNTTCNNQNTASVIQALEFTMSKWDQSQRYEFALQWQNVGVGAPQWRYWDPYQSSGNKWVRLSPPVTQCLAGNTWHTVTLVGDLRSKQVHYQAFIIDAQRYEIDILLDPFPTTAFDHLAVAVQLDGNYAEMPYDLFIDQVSFARAVAPPVPFVTTTPTPSATATASATSTATSSVTPTLPDMSPTPTSIMTEDTSPTIPIPISRFYLPLIVKKA